MTSKKLLMIVLALVLSVLFLVETPVQAEDEKTTRFVNLGEDQVEFNDSFTKDLNGDGSAELTLYYMDDVLVASAEDTNLDGQPDFWLHYTQDWYADMEVHDRDFDGEPDEFVSMDENGQVLSVDKTGIETAEENGGLKPATIIIIAVTIAVVIIVVAVFIVLRRRRTMLAPAGSPAQPPTAESMRSPFEMYCSKCGAPNAQGASFCKKCGVKL